MIYNNLLTIITIGKLITLILMNSSFAWQIHFQEDIIPLNNNQKINLTVSQLTNTRIQLTNIYVYKLTNN